MNISLRVFFLLVYLLLHDIFVEIDHKPIRKREKKAKSKEKQEQEGKKRYKNENELQEKINQKF